MKTCFGYVRVSSHKQGEGISLEAQKDAILRFAAANDIAINRWFEERQTAAKSGRPVFNAMLKALRVGKADGVVMHKIDRSSRNFFDWARIGELADRGIDIHFATESLDFRSRGGRLTANIQMAVAEDYVRNLKAEIHKGQRGQLNRGLYPFKAPIGYRDNGASRLKTIDPVKGPLVRLAFEFYASGRHSLRSLPRALAKRGLTRTSGAPLSKGCLERCLANPFYTGLIHIRRTGETFQGRHEPLISAALYRRVAELKAGKAAKKLTRHNHTFRGLFHCGGCGRAMIPERQKGHVYYRCQAVECRGNCVREEHLDTAIAATLRSVRLSDSQLAAIDCRVAEWCRRGAGASLSHARQLREVDERLARLEDAAIDRIIDADNFARRKHQLLLERAALVEAMARADRNDPARVRQFLERIKNLAEHYRLAPPAEKREITEITTSNRTVSQKNVAVAPANWLALVERSLTVLSCVESRTTSRTGARPDGPAPAAGLPPAGAIGGLIEAASAPEALRIDAVVARHRPPTDTVRRPPRP